MPVWDVKGRPRGCLHAAAIAEGARGSSRDRVDQPSAWGGFLLRHTRSLTLRLDSYNFSL